MTIKFETDDQGRKILVAHGTGSEDNYEEAMEDAKKRGVTKYSDRSKKKMEKISLPIPLPLISEDISPQEMVEERAKKLPQKGGDWYKDIPPEFGPTQKKTE